MMGTSHFKILLPNLFSFDECLVFLKRSEQELLHLVDEKRIYKALRINGEKILFSCEAIDHDLDIQILIGSDSLKTKTQIKKYITSWFDLNRDLKPFYAMAKKDPILKPLVKRYKGYRVIGIPNLFEALIWAIIGQQINLTFAYTLKKRIIKQYGEKIVWRKKAFWLFPKASTLARLKVEDLRTLQFSRRKAEYIIDIAKLINAGELSYDLLEPLEDEALKDRLVKLRGVGEWTANYVMMRCFNRLRAFPIADIGLHRALEKHPRFDERPTIEEIKSLAEPWHPWEAYATFYLWRSLYPKTFN